MKYLGKNYGLEYWLNAWFQFVSVEKIVLLPALFPKLERDKGDKNMAPSRKQNCVDFLFQLSYKLFCNHFLYNLTMCTLIVIVMVYWFKLVALIYPPAPAQSLTVTPSVVEWVKFSRNLQQITLLRPCTLRHTAQRVLCWLVCESMHHQFTNVHTVFEERDLIYIDYTHSIRTSSWMNPCYSNTLRGNP